MSHQKQVEELIKTVPNPVVREELQKYLDSLKLPLERTIEEKK